MLSWDVQLRDVNNEIAELQGRISALKDELHGAQWATDAARVQRVLSVREEHLDRTKLHAQFIESRIAKGTRTVQPIPYSALASICMNMAQRTAQVDTAETLKALAKRFSAKAIADASSRLFGSDPSHSEGAGT